MCKEIVAMAKERSYFARRLQELRKAKGYSQYRVAKLANLTAQAIADIEGGNRNDPRWSTVQAIARVFEVDTNHFCEPE
jgi:transcriptional regulator with XRE-family HTH domain